jgi:4,5-DOPA dioxygenase extradiol
MSIDQAIEDLNVRFPVSDRTMPALFVGHGSPMNAIESNEFSRAWIDVGKTLPPPRAILCISAHWQTSSPMVTAMKKPRTIHDFGGFPRDLFEYQYPAPGSPELAELLSKTVGKPHVSLDQTWGLDHGAWSVLCRMFPNADVPVIQLSLDETQPPAFHYALGQELRPLRQRGVLILGSGNIVHNLRMAFFQDEAYDWALEFDQLAKKLIETGDHAALVNYEGLGRAASLAIPTNEHYLPLLYVLAVQGLGEAPRFFADRVTMGSMSMRSLIIG